MPMIMDRPRTGSAGRVRVFNAIAHAEEIGGYWVEVPELPGCFTEGATLDEVARNVLEAVDCWFTDESEVPARYTVLVRVEK